MRRTPARRVEPGSTLWRCFLASGSSGHDFMRSLSSPRRKVQLPYVIQCIKTAGKLATTSLLDALNAPEAPTEAREVPMVGTLRDVWQVHYVCHDDGRPRWKAGKELPPVGERPQSPYDPQAHYSTKRQIEWSGYKVHLTETCDEDAAHLVTHVMTCPAMQQDMTITAEIHQHLAAKGLLPAEHFVDSAYLDFSGFGG